MEKALAITRGKLGQRPFVVGALNSTPVNGIEAVLQLFTADENRSYLLIQNNSSANLLVGLDAEPQSAAQCIVLGPGNFWEPNVAPTNAIYVSSASLSAARGIAIFSTMTGE